ncbi:MAG: haloacid dehalogenase [Burkholderiales bacterium]
MQDAITDDRGGFDRRRDGVDYAHEDPLVRLRDPQSLDYIEHACRNKQLQYTWLQGLMGGHADFWQVTEDDLDYAMGSLGFDDSPLRDRLMGWYLTRKRLRAGGFKLAILSNGAPKKCWPQRSGIRASPILWMLCFRWRRLTYTNPVRRLYGLATQRLGLERGRICFRSSDSWGAHAGRAFGFQMVQCNRFGQVPERIPERPDEEIGTPSALPEILGI